MDRPLYAYDQVAVPYEDAIELLASDATSILQDATDATVRHAHEVTTRVRVPVAGFEVGRDITIDVGDFEPVEILRVRVPITWHATKHASLFPSLQAYLELSALSIQPPRTQVTLVGAYVPPMGWVGVAGDAAAGHKVAEATVSRFVADVCRRIEERYPMAAVAAATAEE